MQENKVEFKFYSEKLYELRKNKKMSQEELAEKIGVSRQSVYAWENGKSIPDIENLSKLCQILDVKTEDLTNGLGTIHDNDMLKIYEGNKLKKKKIRKFVIILLLVIFLIYLIFSFRKLIILDKLTSKINHMACYNNYYYKNEYGKREWVGEKVNVKYLGEEEIKYKDNVIKIKRTNILENEDMKTYYTWIDMNTREGYSYDVNNKTYSKISAIGALYDTGHIKHISEKSYLGNSNNIFNAFDPFFHIEDTYLHYVIKYKINSNGYNVKIEDYIFKDTAFPHGTWYYSKDNSYTYSRHNIEIGRVTDEDVAKPDLSSYTFVEN